MRRWDRRQSVAGRDRDADADADAGDDEVTQTSVRKPEGSLKGITAPVV